VTGLVEIVSTGRRVRFAYGTHAKQDIRSQGNQRKGQPRRSASQYPFHVSAEVSAAWIILPSKFNMTYHDGKE
jgi:hypothetical protein